MRQIQDGYVGMQADDPLCENRTSERDAGGKCAGHSISYDAVREQLGGALYQGLAAQVGSEFLEHEIEVWDKLIIAVDQGQLRPTHLRCKKPG